MTYSASSNKILGEDDALELDDKEVDELLDVVQKALQGGLADSEVLLRAHLAHQTLAKRHPACDFSRGADSQNHVKHLQHQPNDIQIAGAEDEDDGKGEGDGGCARVPPAQETVEHAMVMRQRLAGRRRLVGRPPCIREVCELVLRCCGLSLHVLAYGTCSCQYSRLDKGFWENCSDVVSVSSFARGEKIQLTSPLLIVSLMFCVVGWLFTAAMADCAARGDVRRGNEKWAKLQIRLSCATSVGLGMMRTRALCHQTYLTVQKRVFCVLHLVLCVAAGGARGAAGGIVGVCVGVHAGSGGIQVREVGLVERREVRCRRHGWRAGDKFWGGVAGYGEKVRWRGSCVCGCEYRALTKAGARWFYFAERACFCRVLQFDTIRELAMN